MSKIGRLWAGKLYGTNTGNLFAEIESSDSSISGLIRFMDDRFGLVVYEVSGTFDGAVVELAGKAKQAPEVIITGDITVKGALTPDGNLRGEWYSKTGTGGTFSLLPHDVPEQNKNAAGTLPEQLHVASRTFGAVRFYADDVRELIAYLKRDFIQGKVVVTFRERGTEISKYASEFDTDIMRLGTLRYLKLQIQEPDAYGISRLAVVEFNAAGSNDIRVQGVQESWVTGKAEGLAALIQEREKFLSTTVKKYGLNANLVLFTGALILMPELSILNRVVFMVAVFFMIMGIYYFHSRFIPNALIRLSASKPTLFERIGPPAFSWFFTVMAGVVGIIFNALLKGEMAFPEWAHFW